MFHANWIEQNNTFKKSLMIFVERTFRPIAAVVGGLFVLNLSTFLRVCCLLCPPESLDLSLSIQLQIVRVAYSLFALLKNVQTA